MIVRSDRLGASSGEHDAATALFAGPGPVRALCRALDWSSTPLGPVERWSPSLRAAVRICLDSEFPMAVWAGPELVVLYNDGCIPVLGPSKHPRVLGCRGHEGWSELWERLGPELERAILRAEPTFHEDSRFVVRHDGEEHEAFFTYSYSPIRDEDGQVVGVLNLLLETTARTQAERALRSAELAERERSELALRRSEERFRKIFENAATGISITDWEGQMNQCNAAFLALVGYTQQELSELNFAELVHPDDRAKNLEEVRRLKAGELLSFELENRYIRKDGETVWVRKFVSVLGGEPAHLLALVTDITDQKRGEAALLESDRRKDEFLAMLGHELRNPLAAVRGATELLERAAPEDPLMGRAVGVLERQTTHMVRLVDGLLDVSRIARGKIDLSRRVLDLREVLEAVLQDRGAEITSHGLEIVRCLPKEPQWVFGDAVRLTQVFDNLLGNAIKFTEPPGRITVVSRSEELCVVVSVQDTGLGIPAPLLSRVFEPFLQAHQDIARATGGLGLGLALVRGLVELHDGTVEAFSAGPGAGARFEVRLPLGTAPIGARGGRCGAASMGRRILVVEDNEDAAQMLHDLLESRGHAVTIAGTGSEALDRLREHGADIVLCDIGLPGMSGYDVARAMRADPSLRDVPLVALTGYGQPEDRRRSKEAGFDEHMTKPASIAALEQVLRRLTTPSA